MCMYSPLKILTFIKLRLKVFWGGHENAQQFFGIFCHVSNSIFMQFYFIIKKSIILGYCVFFFLYIYSKYQVMDELTCFHIQIQAKINICILYSYNKKQELKTKARYIPSVAADKILNKAPILRHIANLLLSRCERQSDCTKLCPTRPPWIHGLTD